MKIFKRILKGFVALIGLILVYFAFIALGPVLEIDAPLAKKGAPSSTKKSVPTFRTDASFVVNGSRVSAFLYTPGDTSRPAPTIVMAHGFGGTKDFILENYALRLREAGFAVLTFDYRFLGKAKESPGNLLTLVLSSKILRRP